MRLIGRLRDAIPRPSPPATLRRFADMVAVPYRAFAGALYRRTPKGLFARTLLIIVAPLVIMQAVLAFVFLERHYNLVTQRLSDAVVRDIALLATLVEGAGSEEEIAGLTEMARRDLSLAISILPPEPAESISALAWMDATEIAGMLEDEHPQIAAVLLA